MPPRERGGYLN